MTIIAPFKVLGREVVPSLYKILAKSCRVGASVGSVSMFTMALLFFPVPRNTFLHLVFRTNFVGLLKYHRWLGYALAYTVLLHGAMFYAYWALIDQRWVLLVAGGGWSTWLLLLF